MEAEEQKKVNENVVEMLKKYYDDSFHIIFATGVSQYEDVKEQLGNFEKENVKVVPYIYNMAEVLAAADLVVSRAGAITVAELAAMGLPSILIPSPYVTANHQEFNARALEVHGAFKGSMLAAWRILRCNPFSKGGYDPVPPKKEKKTKV